MVSFLLSDSHWSLFTNILSWLLTRRQTYTSQQMKCLLPGVYHNAIYGPQAWRFLSDMQTTLFLLTVYQPCLNYLVSPANVHMTICSIVLEIKPIGIYVLLNIETVCTHPQLLFIMFKFLFYELYRWDFFPYVFDTWSKKIVSRYILIKNMICTELMFFIYNRNI